RQRTEAIGSLPIVAASSDLHRMMPEWHLHRRLVRELTHDGTFSDRPQGGDCCQQDHRQEQFPVDRTASVPSAEEIIALALESPWPSRGTCACSTDASKD